LNNRDLSALTVALLIVVFASFSASFAQGITSEDTYYVANTRPPDAFLALRTRPSSSQGQRIATMPNGTPLKVLQRQGDGWWYVRILPAGPEGWALSRQSNVAWIVCCASDKLPQGEGNLEPSRRAQTCIVIDTTPPLNVREMPNGRVIGGLDRGDKVIVNQGPIMYRGEPWVNVTAFNDFNLQGWVYKPLLGSCVWEPIEGN
jgi:hypothetical protein